MDKTQFSLMEQVLTDGLGEILIIMNVEEDSEFTYEWFNRHAREQLGFDDGYIGQTLRESLGEEVAESLSARYQEIVESGNPMVYEDHFFSRSGEEWYTEVKLTPLREEGSVRYIVALVKDVTGKKQEEVMKREVRRNREERTSSYKALFENNGDALLKVGSDGIVKSANPAALRLFNTSQSLLQGLACWDLVIDTDRDHVEEAFDRASGGWLEDIRINIVQEGYSPIGCLLKFTPVIPEGYYVHLKDMRELDKIAEHYLESQSRFKLITENVSDVIVTIDGRWRLLYVSPSVMAHYAYYPDAVVGKKVKDLVHHDDLPNLARGYEEMLQGRTVFRLRIRIRHANGNWIWSELNASAVRGPEGEFHHMVIVIRDIRRQKADEERLEYYAYHDQLTGLPNRRLFLNRLQDRIEDYSKTGNRFAVALMDLDRFKEVNDTWGHGVGDEVIRAFGYRIESAVDEVLAARFGGDEFVILLAACETAAEAEKLARRIIGSLKEPVVAGGHVIQVSTSIGIAFAGPGQASSDIILKLADRAMYEAKAQGLNRYLIVE